MHATTSAYSLLPTDMLTHVCTCVRACVSGASVLVCCLLPAAHHALLPRYSNMIKVVGATVVPVPLNADCSSFDMKALEAAITPKSRVLILNSPSNPTGGVMPREDLDKIALLIKAHPRLWVFSDEIYARLVFDGQSIAPSYMRSARTQYGCALLLRWHHPHATPFCSTLAVALAPPPARHALLLYPSFVSVPFLVCAWPGWLQCLL